MHDFCVILAVFAVLGEEYMMAALLVALAVFVV